MHTGGEKTILKSSKLTMPIQVQDLSFIVGTSMKTMAQCVATVKKANNDVRMHKELGEE